jgi:hypothetical protein
MAVIFVVVVNQWLGERRRRSDDDPTADDRRLDTLRRPIAVFTGAVIVGLLWGLGRGGELVIGIFDATPLLYIPLVYRAATSLFTSVTHYRRLLVGILVALTIEGTHGLIMSRGGRSGLLLPQVPVEWNWNREEFLAHTCRKAGLPLGCWKDSETKIEGFRAIVWGEDDLG